jgi:putative SOS response-associated peptidase YedK
MCGRYVQVSTVETIEKRFNVSGEQLELHPQYNLGSGNFAPIILDRDKHQIAIGQFGLSPSWSKKRMFLFNARSEGDANKENDPNYTGGKGIISKPAFRNSIRSKRCLIIADAFIEGSSTEKLNNPFLVYLRNHQRPFAFAGIYVDWTDPSSGEIITTFSIITTVTNDLLAKIPHHRSPVILRKKHEGLWLNTNSPLTDITRLLQPYPAEEMNAYPISANIKNPKAEGRELIDAIGERLEKEENITFTKHNKLFGMAHSPGIESRNTDEEKNKSN